MELPKNITQIGQVNRNCKVYVEDYVVSYIKQLNTAATAKTIAIALFGVKKEEEGVPYLFVYGAGKLNFLQKSVRHLSQAQCQEIEGVRRKFFDRYVFLGYGILEGEAAEGFYVCEQEICRYVEGYARFYEKNDLMLAYMLEDRKELISTETVEMEKYAIARKNQAERKRESEAAQYSREEKLRSFYGKKHRVPIAQAVACVSLVTVCMLGYFVWNQKEEQAGDIFRDLKSVAEGVWEQKLPDITEQTQDSSEIIAMAEQPPEGSESVQDTLVAEAKLVEEIQAENRMQEDDPEADIEVNAETDTKGDEGDTVPANSNRVVIERDTMPREYVVKRGDTLIGISYAQYGDDTHVDAICELNAIRNPDDIKVGYKILLP